MRVCSERNRVERLRVIMHALLSSYDLVGMLLMRRGLQSDLMPVLLHFSVAFSLWMGVGWAPLIIDCTHSTFSPNALCMPTEFDQCNSISTCVPIARKLTDPTICLVPQYNPISIIGLCM